MISSKNDFKRYNIADYNAQSMDYPTLSRLTFGETWIIINYMRTLRRLEYYENTPPHNFIRKLLRGWYLLKHRYQSHKYNIYIYPNIVEEGLKIVHPGFRRIDDVVKSVGKNCTILPMILFGKKTPDVESGCIEVGDNCYFGTGCTILGPVKIGNNVTVGAGAVVTKDIPDGCVVPGVPAKIIKKS